MIGLLDVVLTLRRIGVIGITEMTGLDDIVGSCFIGRVCQGQQFVVHDSSGSVYQIVHVHKMEK